MGYCKHCGMDSSTEDKCQWCGRPLAASAPQPVGQPPTRASLMTAPTLEELDEEERIGRRNYLIFASVMMVLSACLLVWKYTLHIYVIPVTLFSLGVMLYYQKIIPVWDNDWVLVGILLLAIMFAPGFFVLLGYLGYTLVNKNMDPAVVWLLATYVVATDGLQIVTALSMPKMVPAYTLAQAYGVEKLGYIALVFGWMCGSSWRPAV